MDETTYLDFLNSNAESFAEVLGPLVEDGDVSGQDIYSVLAEFAGQRLTPDLLHSFKLSAKQPLAEAFNDYFEISTVTPPHVEVAVDLALSRWGT